MKKCDGIGPWVSLYISFLDATQLRPARATPALLTCLAVKWELEERMLNWDFLWDYGALTALTDCLYR
jgi:hypothetical protein